MKTEIDKQSVLQQIFTGNRKDLKADLLSGFMVFLLALPLSLGIAKASGFPAAMGVLTAIIGGIFTSFFKVSELTVKGPAAGLITICSGAVLEFGGSEEGWKVAAAAITVAALIQIVFSYMKLGSLSDFFPSTAIHGMLAAIGIIIIAKQIPVLLGDEPEMYNGEGPLELFLDVPKFIQYAHIHIAIVGVVGIIVMFVMPRIKNRIFKMIPAPMVVLLVTVPLSVYWHFKETEPAYSLVQIGDFWGSLKFNVDYSYFTTFSFWKYVFLFLFVNSLESLLTVKATDSLDPYKRSSDYNGDLKGLGAGNFVSGLLGGLPMISEVVRSSANVDFGGRTKRANFFHGVFLLLAMIFLIPFIEMIPNAALAAMLIYAGYRLAAPSHFFHAYRIGKEQLAIFLITIVVILAEDLLLGIAVGILVEFLINIYNGASLKYIFKAVYTVENNSDDAIAIRVKESALFSNLIGFKRMLNGLPQGAMILFDLTDAKMIDHSFMYFIKSFESKYNEKGDRFEILGLEVHKSFSAHPLACKKLEEKK